MIFQRNYSQREKKSRIVILSTFFDISLIFYALLDFKREDKYVYG